MKQKSEELVKLENSLKIKKMEVDSLLKVELTPQRLTKILILSVEIGETEMVKILMEQNMDPDITNKNGDSLLEIAITNKYSDIISLLIDYGANFRFRFDGTTILHWAVQNNLVNLVETLLEKNMDPDITDKNGRTALIFAIQDENIDIILLLIDYGANFRFKFNGTTILHWAVQNNLINLVETLLEKNINPNIKDKEGHSPLHFAVQLRYMNISSLLIEHKARFNPQEIQDKTLFAAYLTTYGEEGNREGIENISQTLREIGNIENQTFSNGPYHTISATENFGKSIANLHNKYIIKKNSHIISEIETIDKNQIISNIIDQTIIPSNTVININMHVSDSKISLGK